MGGRKSELGLPARTTTGQVHHPPCGHYTQVRSIHISLLKRLPQYCALTRNGLPLSDFSTNYFTTCNNTDQFLIRKSATSSLQINSAVFRELFAKLALSVYRWYGRNLAQLAVHRLTVRLSKIGPMAVISLPATTARSQCFASTFSIHK